jgi:hypothetical protein
MTEQFQNRRPRPVSADSKAPALTLPAWLARRILAPNETVALVRGPTSNWFLEPYLTHPGLFLVALVPAGISLGIGRSLVNSWKELPPLAGVIAVLFVFGSIIFLASLAGYFTRLVITDQRLIIVQGREVRSSRSVNELPPILLRRNFDRDGHERAPTIDLNAVNTMLGVDGFVDSNTILTLGKKIDKMREAREDETEHG